MMSQAQWKFATAIEMMILSGPCLVVKGLVSRSLVQGSLENPKVPISVERRRRPTNAMEPLCRCFFSASALENAFSESGQGHERSSRGRPNVRHSICLKIFSMRCMFVRSIVVDSPNPGSDNHGAEVWTEGSRKGQGSDARDEGRNPQEREVEEKGDEPQASHRHRLVPGSGQRGESPGQKRMTSHPEPGRRNHLSDL